MKDNKELFENMPVSKAVSRMAIPTIIGQLIVLIYSMADTFFIGRTNNPQMVAAASLILPLLRCLYLNTVLTKTISLCYLPLAYRLQLQPCYLT